jgi:hypothetical protein
VAHCGGGTTTSETSTDSDGGAASDAASATDSSSSVTDGGTGSDADVVVTDCTGAGTHIEQAVCAANALLATLSASDKALVNLAYTDSADRTKWSNLPGVTRAGVKMSALSATSQATALAMMKIVLSSAGMTDLTGVSAADDYLGSMSGSGGGGGPGGGGGAQYSSGNYTVAIIGTPSTSGNWEVMFGGHHMAYNVTYQAGVGYPVPNHLGVEPKAAFTQGGVSYQPMADEGAALTALFGSLSSTDLSTAYLNGQTFSDVLIGPVEYGTGSTAAVKAKFPTGANRTGVLVSSLSSAQQAMVTTAIGAWVSDYAPEISASLLAEYTSATSYADTYIAWGGTQASGVDVDVNGTYMRIDGPRVWIEVACQAGVVIQGVTHFHSIYRDKQFDYAGSL